MRTVCVIFWIVLFNMSMGTLTTVTTSSSTQHYNQTFQDSNNTCLHWEATWQTRQLKQCPGEDRCIPASASCAKLCNGTGSAADCPDGTTCFDPSAGGACCEAGQRRCPTGDCVDMARWRCPRGCGPRQTQCHDGTCKTIPFFCDCSDMHTICEDGSCKYFSFDCPEYGLYSKDTHRNSLSTTDENELYEYVLAMVCMPLGMFVSCVLSCVCYSKQRAAAAARSSRQHDAPGRGEAMRLQAARRNQAVENVPSHYPVPAGTSPVVLPPLVRPPDYQDMQPDGDDGAAADELTERNTFLPCEPPPSYDSVCQVDN
jgi:hypothetical protein